jgi:hypothetical protein
MTKTHEFNLTGAARKPLIEAIEGFANVKGVYQGAPQFGYAFYGIGVLDKAGALHFDCDPQVITDCVAWLEERGFRCDSTTEESADCNTENETQASDTSAPDTLTIEMPLEGFTPEKLHNLRKLVDSKAGLIKAALGDKLADSELPIECACEERKLQFPWFTALEADEFTAWAWFVSTLCKAAKEAKRVTAKEKPGDNMKFSFRVFLVRLGLVGDEYKNARKILLRNLPGNSAFSKGSQPTYTVNCYTLENGNEEDAMDCESFEFHSLAKAKARADKFLADCESLYFAGVHVEDEKGKWLYEITMDGSVHER